MERLTLFTQHTNQGRSKEEDGVVGFGKKTRRWMELRGRRSRRRRRDERFDSFLFSPPLSRLHHHHQGKEGRKSRERELREGEIGDIYGMVRGVGFGWGRATVTLLPPA